MRKKTIFWQKLPPSFNSVFDLGETGMTGSEAQSLKERRVARFTRALQAGAHTQSQTGPPVQIDSKAFNSWSRIPLFLRTLRSFIAEYGVLLVICIFFRNIHKTMQRITKAISHFSAPHELLRT